MSYSGSHPVSCLFLNHATGYNLVSGALPCFSNRRLRAPGGDTAGKRRASGGEPLRARQCLKTDAELAAPSLTLESGGPGEILAFEEPNAINEAALDERLLDDARASLWTGLRPRDWWRGCRRRRRPVGVPLIGVSHAHSHFHAHTHTHALGVRGSDKEAQEGQGEESSKTGGLHCGWYVGGLLFERQNETVHKSTQEVRSNGSVSKIQEYRRQQPIESKQ
jgi:hypothetical protein